MLPLDLANQGCACMLLIVQTKRLNVPSNSSMMIFCGPFFLMILEKQVRIGNERCVYVCWMFVPNRKMLNKF